MVSFFDELHELKIIEHHGHQIPSSKLKGSPVSYDVEGLIKNGNQ